MIIVKQALRTKCPAFQVLPLDTLLPVWQPAVGMQVVQQFEKYLAPTINLQQELARLGKRDHII